MTRVLAIDCGSVSGFSVDGPEPFRPILTRFRSQAEDEDKGRAFGPFATYIRELIAVHKPEVIAFEAALPPSTQLHIGNSNKSVAMQWGRIAIVEEIAWNANVPCRQENVQTVRKHFLGTARPPDPKKAVMERCKLLGWDFKGDHNIADAAAIWFWAKCKYERAFAANVTPLMMNGARLA